MDDRVDPDAEDLAGTLRGRTGGGPRSGRRGGGEQARGERQGGSGQAAARGTGGAVTRHGRGNEYINASSSLPWDLAPSPGAGAVMDLGGQLLDALAELLGHPRQLGVLLQQVEQVRGLLRRQRLAL